MKKLFTLMIAAAVVAGSCKKDEPALILSTGTASIEAAFTAGSYTITVTGNTAWTAAVSAGATWCTAAPASGSGNGTVTVNVTENPAVEPRAATVTITAGALNEAVAVVQAACPTPTYAASTKTWTFGEQTWSDAIHIPDCNKETFENSPTDPQCRSYTEDSNTWYYYNWPYVNANAATLCPQPWRVPTKDDFDTLDAATTSSALIVAWGFGGRGNGSNMYSVDSYGYYWFSTEFSSNSAYYLYYYSRDLYVSNSGKYTGFQVRCVK